MILARIYFVGSGLRAFAIDSSCTQECVIVKTCHAHHDCMINLWVLTKSNCHSHLDCKLCSRKLYFHTFPHASVRYLGLEYIARKLAVMFYTVLFF